MRQCKQTLFLALAALLFAAAVTACAEPSLFPTDMPTEVPMDTATPEPTFTPEPTPTLEPAPPQFYYGVDASYVQQIEDAGGVYYMDGQPTDVLEIYKTHGVNMIRLRLWVAPIIGYNDLSHTLAMAKRVKEMGMGLMIDFHYSDTWADPGKQYKPAAWASLHGADLEKVVYDYTKDVITRLKKQGTLPEMVQIGNEITPGMLWDDGRVGGANENNWPQFASLLKAGINGVNAALEEGEKVGIVLHVDQGADNAVCSWWYGKVIEQGVPFDYIGLSYYPWWHGSLEDLEGNLNLLALRFQKPILIVETAYPWSLENNDNMGNLVLPSTDILPQYEASVAGQAAFLREIVRILKNVPDGMGKGLFYWAADDITSPRFGSVFENAALFDFEANVLDSMGVFLEP